MTDGLIEFLDKIGDGLSWLTRGRFQWPCWLLKWAWDRRARLDCPADPSDR